MAALMVLDLVREVHGENAARTLAATFGGRDVSLPKVASKTHQIAQVCGLGVLQTLVAFRGGEKLYIPLGPESVREKKRAEVIAAICDGRPTSEIVREYGITRSYVWRLRQAVQALACD